ncbi:sugar MFS transporter [Flavihumibacter solisilvae]|uniref:Major facilitator transporter n=1 Tax=Flavihumibacter solisilvae TaxID=1349421 RepID=A0A0C1L7X9_9BACT|nr:sugar MFS transporter [Flavihumibacter solisilvae]KIC95716.1 major facilitator transporter [Flavihumibacter solisilvae]
MQQQPIAIAVPRKESNTVPMLIIGALFFIFGFVTWANGTLIPYLKIACELTTSEAMLVTFAFYISYAVMAFPSSWVLRKTGFKKGMMLGLILMAIGALIFIPAANSRTYSVFLLGLFVIGTGLALLQTACNPYVTILGPIESAAQRISIMGICNKGAGAIAPLIMGAIMLDNADALQAKLLTLDAAGRAAELDTLASKVIVPYILIAVVLLLLAAFIHFSSLAEIKAEGEDDSVESSNVVNRASIFEYTYLWLGFIALFLYVGVEVLAGDTIQLYGNSLGISLDTAKHFTTYTMLGMLAGYLFGIVAIPKYISQSTALKFSAVAGILFSLGAIFTSGTTSVFFIAILGLANALVWPAIWPLAINGLGKFTKAASALLVVGIAGGALLPKLWASLGEYAGLQQAYWIMVPCYLFILYYAITGHKAGLKK